MLDLVGVREGGTVRQALDLAVRTAQHVEALGYTRYWLAEHHNMPGIASSATAVLIGHVAGATRHIRVGSGGIMLPNHAPLTVAEAFGTLAELYPGRIDLGLGRAPGTDPMTMRALRRDRVEREEDFPQDVAELQRLLGPAQPGQRLTATPGAGTQVPIWLWAPVCSPRAWPRNWACPTPSRPTSRHGTSCRPWSCTAACSVPRRS